MSNNVLRPARAKARTLAIVAMISVLLVAGALIGHRVRKRMMVQRALAEGTTAFERADWNTAGIMLARYLAARPADPVILAKYAQAQLSMKPLRPRHIGQAMNAYRRLLNVNPADARVFRRLALLYETTGNYGDLAYIARRHREQIPDDPHAPLALAKALLHQHKSDAARAELEDLVGRLAERAEKYPDVVEACVLLCYLSQPNNEKRDLEQGLQWLDHAIAYDPRAPLPLAHRAALLRSMSQDAAAEDAERLLADAHVDLARAETLPVRDPRVRLMLCEQWTAHGEFDRAAAQLATAAEATAEHVREFIIDPQDWSALQFIQAAKLALLRGAVADGVQLARDARVQFQDHPRRVETLPLAIDLLLNAGNVAEARDCLTEYTDTIAIQHAHPTGDPRVARVRAQVALAEDKPYEVIDLLEPVVGGPAAPASLRALLAEAYSRTGQLGRMTRILQNDSGETTLSPTRARLLARAYLEQGDWKRAREVLRLRTPDRTGDTDSEILRLTAEVGLACENAAPPAVLEALTSKLAALKQAHPERADVRILLATIADKQGQVADAQAELESAIAECQQNLGASLALARLHTRQRRLTQAEEVLGAACAAHGTEATAWLALSEMLVHSQRIDEARAALHRGLEAASTPDENRRIALRLASIDVVHGNVEAGLAALQALAARDPSDVEVHALLLEQPALMQDPAAAAELLGQIKAVEGKNGLRWRYQQTRLWLAGDDWRTRQDEIADLLKYCVDADPRWAAPVLALGDMYERLGDWNNAEAVYSNGFQLGGSIAVADRLRELLQRQSRFTEVRDLLERMKQKLDERPLSARRLALALGEGRYDEAIRELELRVAGAEKDAMDLVRLAELTYAQNGDVQRANECLDDAAALGAGAAIVARTRAYILRREQRFEEAVAVLDDLVETAQTPEAFLLRASYHANVGATDLAERDYAEVVRVAPDPRAHALLAEFYSRTNRLDEAVTAWHAGVSRYPDSQLLHCGLVRAWLARGEPDDRAQARATLNELAERAPNDTRILWLRAVDRAAENTAAGAAEARALLRSAIRSAPTNADTYTGLLAIAFELGEYETGRELALRGLEVNPGNTDLLLRQAQAELALDELDAARRAARSVLVHDRESPGAYEVILEAARRGDDPATLRRELATLDELVARDPTNEPLQLLRARARVALGDTGTARTELEEYRASDAGRQCVAAHVFLADLYRVGGDFAKAHAYLDVAAELNPRHMGALHARLALLATQKRYDELANLVRTHPGDNRQQANTLLAAATLLAESPTHLDAAIELCQRAASLAPDNVSVQLNLGNLLYLRGDRSAAEQAYRAALQAAPHHAETLNNLAWILAGHESRTDEALACARQAVALRPEDANFHDTLGVVLMKVPDRLEEARDEFRRCAALAPSGSPGRAKALFHLAQVCGRLDDWAPVPGALNEALAIDERGATFATEERTEIERLLEAARRLE